jgi:phosphopantothenoylcysteine decarboxylase / phosphopantothenate---cysteine ligase
VAVSPRVVVPSLVGRRVTLGVTGGIAAYKAIPLARELTLAGAAVDVVLTPGALEFVRPLSFEALTGRPALSEMYTPGDPLLHIRLARESDAVVVAPATANFIARAAAGRADDLLTAVLLATRAPVLVCPAMNDRMFDHPLTRANLGRLREVGYAVAGPDEGPLAWGEGEGPGRMLEPSAIFDQLTRLLAPPSRLSGRRVLVTAGPTLEAIDPVRFIGNRSSGRMGFALASAAWRRGAEVTLITGPTRLQTPTGIDRVDVESASDMHEAVARRLPPADVLVMAAAVADFRPATVAGEKIKKAAAAPEPIALEPTEDVLLGTLEARRPGAVVVGFALETEAPLENGRRKLRQKKLDLLVVNDAREPGAGFDVDTNRVTLIDAGGDLEELPLLSKQEVADRILDRIDRLLASRSQ